MVSVTMVDMVGITGKAADHREFHPEDKAETELPSEVLLSEGDAKKI
jgi:hypothetical protein